MKGFSVGILSPVWNPLWEIHSRVVLHAVPKNIEIASRPEDAMSSDINVHFLDGILVK